MSDLLTTDQAAELVHTSERTLVRWRVERTGPPFMRAGRRVLYRRADIDTWLESSRTDPVAV